MKPYRPISAAEGDFFIAAQCGNCTKQDGCRIVLLTMVRSEDDPKYPKEWVSDADGNNPRCTAREVTLATVLAEDMVPTDREEPGSVTFTAAEVEHLRGLVRLRAAAQRVVKERDALRTECDDLRRVFSLVHGSLGIQQGEHIGNAIDALKKERDELATRLRQSIARGDFAEMRLATLAAELETERERHRQTAAVPQSVDVPRTHPVPCDPPEATHITPDGKATAQAAVTPQPGDVRSEGCMNWPLSCVEIVKGADK